MSKKLFIPDAVRSSALITASLITDYFAPFRAVLLRCFHSLTPKLVNSSTSPDQSALITAPLITDYSVPRAPLITDYSVPFWRCFLLLLAASSASAGIPEPDLVWYGKVSIRSGDVLVRATSGTLAWQVQAVTGSVPFTVSTTLTNIHDQFSFIVRVPCETPEPGVASSSNTVVLTTPSVAYSRVTVTLDGQPLTIQSASGQFSPTLNDRGRPERVDLVLGALPADTDGDGMADSWEMQHFGSLGAQPGDDPDHDGVSNLKEYQAGTNPTDPASRFEMLAIAPGQGGMVIQWSSQPGRAYTVRRTANLTAPPSTYQVVQAGIAATPPVNTYVDQTSLGGLSFYLIQIDQ